VANTNWLCSALFWQPLGLNRGLYNQSGGDPGSAVNRQAFASPSYLDFLQDLHDPQIRRLRSNLDPDLDSDLDPDPDLFPRLLSSSLCKTQME
jgi:hypothetical protein